MKRIEGTSMLNIRPCSFLFAFLFVLPLWAGALPDDVVTLVVMTNTGKPKPGLAKSWKEVDGKIAFELQPGVDGASIQKKITERLAHLKAVWDGKHLVLEGVPAAALFEQLSFTALEGEVDPLASLSGLDGPVANLSFPEAGGAIRASKPMSNSGKNKPLVLSPKPKDFVEGKIKAVEKGNFPHVSLTVEILSAASTNKISKPNMKAGKAKRKSWKGPVVFIRDAMGISLRNRQNQNNLSANYLHEGDSVRFVPIFKNKRLVGLDWIERL